MAFDLDGEELKYNKEHPTGVYFPEEIKIVNPRVAIYNFSGLQIMKNIEKLVELVIVLKEKLQKIVIKIY